MPDEQRQDSKQSGADLAREALAQARFDARRRGQDGGRRRDGAGPARRPDRREGGQAASRDPESLGSAISGLIADRGWELPRAVGEVFARWSEIVGAELAAHAQPESFEDGELVVVADSTAWATQVRLLSGSLVGRLCEELGDGAVRRVRVRGPTAPSWSKGRLRAPGGQGPRDTYG